MLVCESQAHVFSWFSVQPGGAAEGGGGKAPCTFVNPLEQKRSNNCLAPIGGVGGDVKGGSGLV